jgi:catechol 2,3-dioxygenase-like lactoylglutathione lyase family enzyme
MPKIARLDHFVLTVASVPATVAFYRDVLGMTADRFYPADGSQRWALTFGKYKINLHQGGAEFKPHARRPILGAADFCLISDDPLSDWQAHLAALKVAVEQGPVARTGAAGPLMSIYLRDPDGNLIEIANYV